MSSPFSQSRLSSLKVGGSGAKGHLKAKVNGEPLLEREHCTPEKKIAEVRLKTAAADKCECFSRHLEECGLSSWLLIAPPIHLMWSENQCYLVTADLLHIGLTFRHGHISSCNYNSFGTFSSANPLWKVCRLILLLPQKSNKCWNVAFRSSRNESFVVVSLFDSKHKQSSIAAYLHCFSLAPHRLCWAPTVYSHFESAAICQSHETHNCSPIHSVNTLFKKSSLWGNQLNHRES